MIRQIKNTGYHFWVNWAKKRIKKDNPQILNAKTVYILPSGFGWIYCLVVLSLFTGAINYQISTIFLMTFLLALIGLISAWETHTNLDGMSIQFVSIEDAQQGSAAQLKLFIQPQQKISFAIEVEVNKQPKVRLEKIPSQGLSIILPIATNARGFFCLPRIIVSTQFPLGIFRAWSYVYFEADYYVYPQAIDPGFFPIPVAHSDNKNQISSGEDELYDLQEVDNPWVQPNRIAWKIAAKGQGWYLKTMSSSRGEYWLFRLSDLTKGDLETKLGQMSYWLYAAEAKGVLYAMELGHLQPYFSQGEEHLKSLLRQLAIYS